LFHLHFTLLFQRKVSLRWLCVLSTCVCVCVCVCVPALNYLTLQTSYQFSRDLLELTEHIELPALQIP